jgi:hypothetical protein
MGACPPQAQPIRLWRNRCILEIALVGDIEALKFSGKILPRQIHIFNHCQVGPFLAPLENGINSLLRTFKNSFDRAAGFISNPTQNAKALSSTLGFDPKKNTLNPSRNNDMRAHLFFHSNLQDLAFSNSADKPISWQA